MVDKTKCLINGSMVGILASSAMVLNASPASEPFHSQMENTFVELQVEKSYVIKGVVQDASQQPIIGATILVEGTTTGTATDLDGGFSLEVTPGNRLHISCIGYRTQVIEVSGQNNLVIKLQDDTQVLDAVVVTALGIKRAEKALSYNVQEVKSDELTAIKDANFVNTLAGKIAGVNINSSASGIGGATRVVMRGTKSINSNNNALYVIDGVPIINTNNGTAEGMYASQPRGEGISDLNPEDIESMTVLTGPAAAALYGSNAANGAIIITTKKGSAGKPKITVSNNTNFMSPFILPKFQNTYGNNPGSYDSWGAKLATPSTFDPADFFNTGYTIQNAVSMSVGSEKNQTYASVATTNAAGIIPNNEYSRYNFTVRNTTSFWNDRMTFDFGASYILQEDQNMMAQGKYYNPLISLYTFPRGENFDAVRAYERYDEGRKVNTQYWPWGSNGYDMQNPYWIAEKNIIGTKKSRYMLNASLKMDITDWMNVVGRVRVDNSVGDYTKKLYAGTSQIFAGPKGFYGQQKEEEKQVYADVLVNINKTLFEDYSLSANIGTSYSDASYDMNGFQGPLRDLPNFFSLYNIDKNGRDAMPLQDGWHEQTQSVFANLELGWKSQVYLTLSGRNDWASALAKTPQLSFFYPSVGLSWIPSATFELPELFSYVKVRGSYSSVGAAIPRYLSQPTYAYNPKTETWETVTHYPIGKLYPERTKSWEIGLNLKFWENRFYIDATYYQSNTYNQLFNVPISAASGYSSMYIQSGNVQNRGFEIALGANNTWGDFNWESILTVSSNENKIISLVDDFVDPVTGEITQIPQLYKDGVNSVKYILQEGGSMGDLYTTSALKRDQEGNYWVDPETGKLAVENDVVKFAGSVFPKCNLGFRNNFSWKNFNLGVMVSARLGGVVVSSTQAILDGFGVTEQTAIARDNGGVDVNFGKVPAEEWYTTVGRGEVLSHYIYSATNVRLQELSFGYNFPRKWFNDVVGINVSVVGRNLWMIYNKAPFDPELTASTGTYYQGIDYFMQPSLRNIGFSLKFQF